MSATFTINPSGGGNFTSLAAAVADVGVLTTTGVVTLDGFAGTLGAATITNNLWAAGTLVLTSSTARANTSSTDTGVAIVSSAANGGSALTYTDSGLLGSLRRVIIDGIQFGSDTESGKFGNTVNGLRTLDGLTIQNCKFKAGNNFGSGAKIVLSASLSSGATWNVVSNIFAAPSVQTSTDFRMVAPTAANGLGVFNFFRNTIYMANATSGIAKTFATNNTLNTNLQYNLIIADDTTSTFIGIRTLTGTGAENINANSNFNITSDTTSSLYGTSSIQGPTSDTIFAGASAGNFNLGTQSSALGIGLINNTGLTADIVGTALPQRTLYDAGAIEKVRGTATTWYVGTVADNGNNQNSGVAPSAPFLTLNRATVSAIAGDIVNVGSGSFTETLSGRFVPGITLNGSGTDQTLILNATISLGGTAPGCCVTSNILNNITINANGGSASVNYTQAPWGKAAADAGYTSMTATNCVLLGVSDSAYFVANGATNVTPMTVNLNNVHCFSLFDAYRCFDSSDTTNLTWPFRSNATDCTFAVTGPRSYSHGYRGIAVGSGSEGAVIFTSTIVNVVSNDTVNTATAVSLNADRNASIYFLGGTLSTSIGTGAGSAIDANNQDINPAGVIHLCGTDYDPSSINGNVTDCATPPAGGGGVANNDNNLLVLDVF